MLKQFPTSPDFGPPLKQVVYLNVTLGIKIELDFEIGRGMQLLKFFFLARGGIEASMRVMRERGEEGALATAQHKP